MQLEALIHLGINEPHASSHVFTVFKSSPLYDEIESYGKQELPACGKGVRIWTEHHHSVQGTNSAFNEALSVSHIRIEHAFGILKARWSTLHSDIPIRIGIDAQWTMACVVLHNMLSRTKGDESWLKESMEQNMPMLIQEPNQNQDGANEKETEGEATRDIVKTLGV